MNLKKFGKVLTSKSVGTGPSSYEKRIYRAAVLQRLRNTVLEHVTERKIEERGRRRRRRKQLLVTLRKTEYAGT